MILLWDLNQNVHMLKEIFESGEKGRQEVLELFGYVEPSTDTMTIKEIETQLSVNEKIIRETEIMFNHVDTFTNEDGSMNQFYLEYGDTSSMRNTVRSDLNYQESKIHREFIFTDAYKSIIPFTAIKQAIKNIDFTNMSTTEMLEVMLSTSFDLDPDKTSGWTTFNTISHSI